MVSILREGIEKRELTHINENCVGCGICSDICPQNAINLGPILPIARGLLEMDLISMNKNKCVLCGICSFSCPFDAINFEIDNVNAKTLLNYPKWGNNAEINEEDCLFCRKCEIHCPRDAIVISRELPEVKDLVIGEVQTEVDKCISCRICEEMCPASAITIKENINSDSDKFNAAEIDIDKDKCVYCKICAKVCSENALRVICTTCMESDLIPTIEISGDVLIDKKQCVNCSWCEQVCPTNAASVTKPFEGKVIQTETEDAFCKGDSCHACLDVCPANAVEIIDNKSIINEDFCILCGACEKACPQKILSTKRESMNLDNIKSESWEKILTTLIK
jgi:4Fe-4S ferredoxin